MIPLRNENPLGPVGRFGHSAVIEAGFCFSEVRAHAADPYITSYSCSHGYLSVSPLPKREGGRAEVD